MQVYPRMIAAALLLAVSAPTQAGNSLVAPGAQTAIAHSSISATADGEWNRLGRVDGKNIEVWTRDGDNLNMVKFFGGLPAGETLLRERDKKNAPLPKIADGLLLPDIPGLLESTYRSQFAVNRMSIDSQEATTVSGKPAIRFTYSFIRSDDEIERKGEAVGAVIDHKLFLTVYEAPAIYFFDKDVDGFRKIVSTLKF